MLEKKPAGRTVGMTGHERERRKHRQELKTAWEADWIWRSRRVRVNDFAYFRKEFRVRGPLKQAILF
jgi:alpha-L-rhamnosidase